ncbi:putative MFS family arabinose efflux permease [Williamsia limnetica]|uniref:Putative MFS family arabinose efflux permease n=1 Tax=Williamsia limnetica TaxID=882452 RepID=A0A318S108_WILLI|nr:MFS transporter [Williamsia limnetica]PYE16865.1 putative MFS family arabinose efflux permease [Williamsia limnetica]
MTSSDVQDIAVQARRSLVVSALGTLLVLVAFTTPLSTINATAASLDAGVSGTTWILSSMSIGLTAALLSTGTIADDYGRRRTLVIGLLVVAAGSIVGVLIPDVVAFVLTRIVVGIGGAAVIASSLGIIAHSYAPGPARAAASGIWGASVGAGIAIGPLLSALLERVHSWHDAYWVLAAAAVALAVTAEMLVPESRSEHRRGLDLPGAVLFAGGISALLAALVEGRQGWSEPTVIVLFVVAGVVLALFWFVEYRSATSMLELSLLRSPAFAAATVAAFVTGAGVVALMSFMSGFLGSALGISAVGAALLLFAWSATSVVTAIAARRISPRVSGRVQLSLGLIGVAVGLLGLAGINEGSGWVRFLPGLVVAGIASGVVNAALGREAVASVPAGRGGMGSGANNTARYVGSAIGVTVVAVIATHPRTGSAARGLIEGWNVAAVVAAVISLIGGVAVLALHTRVVSVESAAAQKNPMTTG